MLISVPARPVMKMLVVGGLIYPILPCGFLFAIYPLIFRFLIHLVYFTHNVFT
jgi:hypothetical protein